MISLLEKSIKNNIISFNDLTVGTMFSHYSDDQCMVFTVGALGELAHGVVCANNNVYHCGPYSTYFYRGYRELTPKLKKKCESAKR